MILTNDSFTFAQKIATDFGITKRKSIDAETVRQAII